MVDGWHYKRIGSLATILNGGTPSTKIPQYWDGGINWCTPSDITKQNSKYIYSTERTISKEGLSNSGAILLPAGTILLCTRATIGESSIAAQEMCTNQGFKNLICTSVDNEFLYYALQPLKAEMISNSYGSTFLELSKSQLEQIEVFVPIDENEQHSIAVALSEIDELIVYLEKLIEKKTNIKMGALYNLLGRKQRLSGFNDEWDEVKLNDLCRLITKQTGFDYTATIQPSLLTSKSKKCLPFLQTKNFRGRSFNFDTDYYIPSSTAEEFPKLLLNEKCLLFSIVGASVGNIGLYPGNTTTFCGGAIGIAKMLDPSDAAYVYYYMCSEQGQVQIEEVTKGGAQATVTIADIRDFRIQLPKKGERDAITEVLGDMDLEIEALTRNLEKYRALKFGMMNNLLTGKTRIQCGGK